jgi:hypothetical protein
LITRILAVVLAALAVGSGCGSLLASPDLGEIYSRAARHHGPARNPVIVIPGVLGSRLVDAETGRVVWGSFAGNYADPRRAEGARLVVLPMAEGVPLAELRDGVRPAGVLDRVRVTLLRLPIEQKAYFHLLGALGAGGYRDEELAEAGAIDYGEGHFTCFQFAYDWRRDNVENARRLAAFIEEKRAYVAGEYTRRFGVRDPEVRFDIVAHSMGGLVTRYYLRYGDAELPDEGPIPVPTWAGAHHVERVVFVATPNAGSLDALRTLHSGRSFSWVLPHFGPEILGTMPGIYQLLPRARHGRLVDARDPSRVLDPLDPDLWEQAGWGLAAPDLDPALARILPEVDDPTRRRAIALDHQRKSLARARRFAETLDAPATPPSGTSLYLAVGDSEPTEAVVAADLATGELRALAHEAGDGVVTRSSALLDERAGRPWRPEIDTPIAWNRVSFVFADHLAMTRDPSFTDNLLFLLLEERRDARPAR